MNHLFLDTEFTGLHQGTTLISIALVNGDKQFYGEFTDYDQDQVDDWLQENVINNLTMGTEPGIIHKDDNKLHIVGDKKAISNALKEWLFTFPNKMVIISDCLAYDWMMFCGLFGGGLTIEEEANVSYIPLDICTMMADRGIDPDISREEFAGFDKNDAKHNCLWDARMIEACFNKLIRSERESPLL